jgi:hypothetical protein
VPPAWQVGQAHLPPLVFCVRQLKTEAELKPTEQPAAPLGLTPRGVRRAVFCHSVAAPLEDGIGTLLLSSSSVAAA